MTDDDRDQLTHLLPPNVDGLVAACGAENPSAVVSASPEFAAKVIDCPDCRSLGNLDE